MKKLSAGVLLFRRRNEEIEVFLVHPGGPYWAKKDLGAWSLPKGEYAAGEDPLAAAKREFAEETSFEIDGPFVPLGELTQPSGKVITAWALERDLDPSLIKSNTFRLEWPPRSGKAREFPEVDAGGWFGLAEAARKLAPGQVEFVRRLSEKL
jgi:predicted NUDIX family NTP pyrophosphohydrolase